MGSAHLPTLLRVLVFGMVCMQAKLFNDPDNQFSVMVASDAVGMGLNLNIRRIIFHSLTKYEGMWPF